MTTAIFTKTWGGLVLETHVEYGHAARRNRGRYAGQKIHKLFCEYVVGLEDGYRPQPGTVGAAYLRTGKPVLFSARPACGCCQGQMAGSPRARLTAEHVTCEKCATKI